MLIKFEFNFEFLEIKNIDQHKAKVQLERRHSDRGIELRIEHPSPGVGRLVRDVIFFHQFRSSGPGDPHRSRIEEGYSYVLGDAGAH